MVGLQQKQRRTAVLFALGAVLGVVLAIWYDRRVKARGGLSFTIVRVF